MKIKIGLILTVLIIFYGVGFIGNPLPFTMIFPILALTFVSITFLLLTDLIWKFLNPGIRAIYSERKIAYRTIILLCSAFLFFCVWLINRYFLPREFNVVSIVGNLGILLFAFFLGWNLLKQNKKRFIFVGTAVFISLISSLSIVSSTSNTSTGPAINEALKSLPYLTWIAAEKNIQKSGVTKHDYQKSYSGINIYSPSNLSTAYLMDLSGNVLHTWTSNINDDYSWHHVEMYNNGDLLAIIEDLSLTRLDLDSNVKWIKKKPFHHDIAIDQNGDIYSLVRRDEVIFKFGLPVLILNDYVLALSPEGNIKKEISLFGLLKNHLRFTTVIRIYGMLINPYNILRIVKRYSKYGKSTVTFGPATSYDIFHTNTVEVLDRDIKGLAKRGDLLISVRQLNLIGIIDPLRERFVWHWGPGDLDWQHHPTFLENGNILIFDNGYNRTFSRVIELNPLTKKIEWEYEANSSDQFYSSTRGSSQRLPNGNTLITESNKGRVFEITKSGDIVWEFYNPEVKTDEGKRAAIYRMMRLTDPENYPFLKGKTK